MNYSNHRLTLDIHSTASQVTIRVKKGDNNRRICAVLTENGKPYKIAEGVSAVFRAKKPTDSNGKRAIVFNDVDEIKDNTIFFTLVGDYTNVAGESDCEFTLSKNGKVLTSPRFTIIIENTVNTDEEVEEVGKDEITALTSLRDETTALKNEVQAKLENGEFVGEQGVPGEKGDKGDRGEKGDPGYTPVKGKDYYTEADKADMLNVLSTPFANAIKGTAEGKMFTVYDASPVEHNLRIKLTSDTITDFSAVSVSRFGKNLFDKRVARDHSNWINDTGGYRVLPIKVGKGNTVTVSYQRDLTTQVPNCPYFMLTPQSSGAANAKWLYHQTLVECIKKSATITATDDYIYLRSNVAEADKLGYFMEFFGNDLQIEAGSVATVYEPYRETQTVTANADGTVDGLTSAYYTMTLSTDNANAYIECEYNRDISAVFAEIAYQMEELFRSAVSRISYIDLPSAGWQGSESPYHQVVDLYGITEYSKVDLNPSVEQLDIFHDKDIAFVTENEGGVVTVYCIGQKPADDYYMQVSITEVMTID